MNQPNQSSSPESSEHRDKMLAKVRKLLTFAHDGRGNEQEAETALRQAQALMAKYNIEEAEAIEKELHDQSYDAIISMWRKASMYIDHSGQGLSKNFPQWGSILAVGVARLYDCRCVVVKWLKEANGQAAIFAGYKTDVMVACWTFDYLVECVRRRSIDFHLAVLKAKNTYDLRQLHEEFELPDPAIGELLTTDRRAYNNSFRIFMAGRLQKRMKEMKEQWRRQQVSGSRTLMVLDMKLQALKDIFGEEGGTEKAQDPSLCAAAALAGQIEANKTRLQPNPLNDSSERLRLTRS